MYCLCKVFQQLSHIVNKHANNLVQVSSPVELEQCDEETLADILGTEARVAFPLTLHSWCMLSYIVVLYVTAFLCSPASFAVLSSFAPHTCSQLDIWQHPNREIADYVRLADRQPATWSICIRALIAADKSWFGCMLLAQSTFVFCLFAGVLALRARAGHAQ